MCYNFNIRAIIRVREARTDMRLLSFSVQNFRSFYRKQIIRFDDSKNNVSAIFGANGSGKSNLIKAIEYYIKFIIGSTQANFITPSERFALIANNSLDTMFSAEFNIDGTIYKYSFSYDRDKITSEKLSRKSADKNYTTIFSRSSVKNGIYSRNGFTYELLSKTRPDTLLLTKAWEDNVPVAKIIRNAITTIAIGQHPISTIHLIENNKDNKIKILDFMRSADLGIQDVEISKTKVPLELLSFVSEGNNAPEINQVSYEVKTAHIIKSENGTVAGATAFNMLRNESSGTRRMFELAGPIINTLENGGALIIDDFEAYLHQRECNYIINLFLSERNTKNAQLIINTHDILIMDKVGRNSIYLVGKNNLAETTLSDVPKIIRSDDKAIGRKYSLGLVGAVPNIREY